MADKTGKTWMAIGETDDPNAVIESYEAEAAVTKGDPVYLILTTRFLRQPQPKTA